MTSGDTTWYYIYDADGMRTSRTTDGAEYIYEYIGGQLTHMSYGITTMHFTYDAAGRPATVIHNGTVYYYVTNLQGDVVALVDSAGAQVVGYTYDAWGRPLTVTGSKASTLGLYNPLRYRSYVYDQETGLYYLQSRYYNPTIGRFLNADAFVSTGQGLLGNNMFIYCLNNPVNYYDTSGNAAISVCNGDRNPLFIGHIGLGSGGGGGGGNSKYQDIFEELEDIKDKTMDAVGSVAEECWDAYMRGYNMQQNSQLQEAQIMIGGVKATYSFLDETGAISVGMSGYHAVQAARAFKKSATYFAAPIPTVVDEAFALGFLVKGLYHSAKAIWRI